MSVALLIATGENLLSIPCRVFKNKEQAELKCDKLLRNLTGCVKTTVKEEIYYKFDTFFDGELITSQSDLETCISPKESLELMKVTKDLFTEYDNACGYPKAFVIKEVNFDEAFVPWDLD